MILPDAKARAAPARVRRAVSSASLRTLQLAALALVSICLGACAATSAHRPGAADDPRAGHLVIVGGGLQDDNRAVYERFAALASARGDRHTLIGIIPIASGDGLKAGEEAADRWAKWVNNRVEVIPMTKDDAALAADPCVVQVIDRCSAVWFIGGDQSRITAVLRPDGRSTPALEALRRLLTRGGVIGGTSAGAAIMSDPMILGGTSADSRGAGATTSDPDNPARSGVRTGPGLGFFSDGIVDQHFLERNRMGRLIDAVRSTGRRFGYGVSENCAMVVDLQRRVVECIGVNGVCVIDVGTSPTTVRVLSTGERLGLEGAPAR